jgi:hypothetical protein
MRILDRPERGGIDQVNVPLDQSRESLVGTALDILTQ